MFIPTDPLTVTFMIAVWTLAAACLGFGGRPERFMGAALLVSWIAARTATVTDFPLTFVAGSSLAAFIAFCGASQAARVVSWIYGAKIILSSLLIAGVMNSYWLWIINNEVFLAAQLLIIAGSLIDGTFTNGKIAENVNRIFQFKAKSSQDFHK